MASEAARSRFVILQHDHPFPHLDLLMQDGEVLKAWRLPEDFTCGVWLAAEALADHRIMYLDYEGPVSGGRGTVSRLAAGTFESIPETAETASSDQAFMLFDCHLATHAACRNAAAAAVTFWRFL